MAAIPERVPVGDAFTGVVVKIGRDELLAPAALPGTTPTASGNFTLRYGLRFLGKLHLSIVPGLVAIDYGEMLTGEAAWDFLLKRSNLYPRAEVLGYRDDGSDDMVFVKTLDVAVPPQVLVYADAQATTPIARPAALIAAQTDGLPSRLLEYLAHYPTLTEWEAKRK